MNFKKIFLLSIIFVSINGMEEIELFSEQLEFIQNNKFWKLQQIIKKEEIIRDYKNESNLPARGYLKNGKVYNIVKNKLKNGSQVFPGVSKEKGIFQIIIDKETNEQELILGRGLREIDSEELLFTESDNNEMLLFWIYDLEEYKNIKLKKKLDLLSKELEYKFNNKIFSFTKEHPYITLGSIASTFYIANKLKKLM